MSYYYFRGVHSVYVDYERGCGEWCFEGEPTQTQYFLAKLLPVACSFIGIAVTTMIARWVSNSCTLKCPFGSPDQGTVTGAQNVQWTRQDSPQKMGKLTPNVSIQIGRPDMTALIDVAVAKVEAVPGAASFVQLGLFVCVCGPETLVQSCKTAVREVKSRRRGVTVGLHAEEPEW
jgi:hypothetical protein